MALYGTASKYGEALYGNPTYITTLGTQYQSFIDAQNADVRRVSGQLVINSHMTQMGRNVLGNSEIIGGVGTARKAQSFVAPYAMSLAGVSMMLRAGAVGNTDDVNISLQTGMPSGIISWYKLDNETSDIISWRNGTGTNVTGTTDRFSTANSAYSFNGTNSNIQASNAGALFGNCSLTAWVYSRSTANAMIVSNISASANRVLLGVASGSYVAMTYNGTGYGYSPSSAVPINSWTHLALTSSGTITNLYVNGVLSNFATNFITSSVTTSRFTIGMREDGNTPYNGCVDDVKIYNRPLTQNEITNIYNNSIADYIPSGTIVGSTVVTAPQNLTLEWKKATFNSPITLASGSTYWIVAKNNLNSTNTYYTGYDQMLTGDWNSASFASGTWTVGTTKQYMARTISNVEVENDKQVAELTSFKLVRDAESPANQLTCEIINANQKYSEGEAYSDYMQAGNECRAYIGYSVAGTPQYYQVFKGITENSPVGVSNGQILAKDYMGKMLGDYTSSGTLGGVAYETAIQTIATRSGIASFALRTTGKNTANPLTFQNTTTSDICEKIREATSDVMQFRNDGTLKTEANAKLTTTSTTTPKYTIEDTSNMITCEVEKVTDKLINRITITNDENGETSVDMNTLKVGDYITLATGTYSLGSTTATQNGTLTFSHSSALGYPAIYIDWNTQGTQLKLTEVSRYCGTYGTYGNLQFTLNNKAYGVSAGTTTLTVLGCPISNAGANTVLSETLAQSSYESYGRFSQRYDNKVIANLTDANGLGTSILNQYSEPIRNVNIQSKGIVDLYPNDVIAVTEPTRLKLDNLAVTRVVELDWNNDPAMFTNNIQAWKTDINRSRGIELAGIMKKYLPDPRLIIVPALIDTTAGNIETDFSGTGNNATYVATVSSDKDAIGKTPILNLGATNTTKYLTVADNSNLSFGNGTVDQPFSICAWIVPPPSTAASKAIGGKWGTTSGANREYALMTASRKIYGYVLDVSANAYIAATSVSSMVDNEVQFLCMTYNGLGSTQGYLAIKLYVNGVEISRINGSSGTYTAMENGTAVYQLGSSAGTSYIYKGELGIQAVTGGELTADQILNIYNETKGYYGV